MYLWLEKAKWEQPLAMCLKWCPLGDWFFTQTGTRLRMDGKRRENDSLEKEKNIFSVFSSIQNELSPCPSEETTPLPAVTCQSSPDRHWPCSVSLETIWIGIAILSCFHCWFPRQLTYKGGAALRKTVSIRSQKSWYIKFKTQRLSGR